MREKGQTTRDGSRNRNGQINLGCTNRPGTDYGQDVSVLYCPTGDRHSGSNGSDIFQRKCPSHQGGRPGLPRTPAEEKGDMSGKGEPALLSVISSDLRQPPRNSQRLDEHLHTREAKRVLERVWIVRRKNTSVQS